MPTFGSPLPSSSASVSEAIQDTTADTSRPS